MNLQEKKRKQRKLLREFISQSLSATVGIRNTQNSIVRFGEKIRPGASAGTLSDEEEEFNNLKQAACVLIQSDEGLILAVSRKDNPEAFGLPGGKVDPGEDAKTAAARELKEETGLIATNLNLIFQREDVGSMCSTFAGEISGEIDTNESGVIRWVTIDVLLEGPYSDYNKALFKHLGQL